MVLTTAVPGGARDSRVNRHQNRRGADERGGEQDELLHGRSPSAGALPTRERFKRSYNARSIVSCNSNVTVGHHRPADLSRASRWK